MICRECGAYNPDHAEFCKVCAANLKGKAAPVDPVASEEEEQPTKRFRPRPSWIPDVDEQSAEETAENAEEAVEEVAAEAAETVQADEQPVEEAAEEETDEPEEEPVQVWSPVASRRRAVAVKEEPEEDSSDAEEENEGIYNDEEALEEEDDPFEYEPTPPKRKSKKKKNNTLFTVLLIAIIVVIVGILVLGGYMLLKNQLNCGSTPARTGEDAAQTSVQNSPDPGTNVDVKPSEAPVSLDAKTAQLQEVRDENNNDLIAITYVVPANSTIVIDFPNQDDFRYENSEGKDITRKVKIPVEVFYPNQPLEQDTIEFRPDITIEAADGTSYKVDCPSFTRTFPKLNITITEPLSADGEPAMAPENNIISLSGNIDEPTAEVTVNGVVTTIYAGGIFMYDYKFADDATEDTVDTIEIVAKKNNYVSDTKEVKVHAYKFVPDPMKLEVKAEGNTLRADKDGKLTVTGTTLPGAELEAVSDNTTNVLCGTVNVDGEGNFSFQVTMDPSFYGMSTITLVAHGDKIGALDGTTTFRVLRSFADKEAFLKYYNKTKTYLEIAPKKTQIADLLANQTQYANSGYGFRITASVVEVITVDGDTIVKMTVNKSNETIYVHNLSSKWTPGENVGGRYNVYCNFVGTYEDTGCCEFLGWFAQKK